MILMIEMKEKTHLRSDPFSSMMTMIIILMGSDTRSIMMGQNMKRTDPKMKKENREEIENQLIFIKRVIEVKPQRMLSPHHVTKDVMRCHGDDENVGDFLDDNSLIFLIEKRVERVHDGVVIPCSTIFLFFRDYYYFSEGRVGDVRYKERSSGLLPFVMCHGSCMRHGVIILLIIVFMIHMVMSDGTQNVFMTRFTSCLSLPFHFVDNCVINPLGVVTHFSSFSSWHHSQETHSAIVSYERQ